MTDAAPLILLNPQAAGGRAATLVPRLNAALLAMGVVTQVQALDSTAQARARIAALPAPTRVVLVGGDGSLLPLLPELSAGGHSVGLVPAGTGNDMSRALGMRHLPLEQALQVAVDQPATPMDLGHLRFDGRETLFASSLTLGFDTVVAYRAQNSPRWLPGQLHYLWTTLAELRALSTWPVRLRIGLAPDQPPVRMSLTAHLFSVLNTPSYGSGMPIAPGAQIDDGRFHLLTLTAQPRLQLLLTLQQMLRGAHMDNPAVSHHLFDNLVVESDKPIPMAVDGDCIGQTHRLEVQCLPQALRVVRR